jgi:hypothetical protein
MPTIEVTQHEADVLCDIVDLYLGQMEDARTEVTSDHTIESLEDLLDVQGSLADEEALLKKVKHQLRGCCDETG